jgi:tyrosine-protein kinase Etk/Wzc
LTCLIALGANFYFLKTVKPVYQAEVLVLRSSQGQSEVSSDEKAGSKNPEPPSSQAHMRLLTLESALTKVQERLKTEHQLQFEVTDIYGHFSLSMLPDSPFIILKADATTSQRAQALANVVAEVYTQTIQELKNANLSQNIALLKEQIQLTSGKLTSVKKAIEESKAKEKHVFVPEVGSSNIQQLKAETPSSLLQQVEVELAKTRADVEWNEMQLKSIQNLIAEAKRALPTLSPQLEKIQSQLTQKQLQRDVLLGTFTEKDSEVVAVQRELDALQELLQGEFDKMTKEQSNSQYQVSELQQLIQQSISLNVKWTGLKQKETLLKDKIAELRRAASDAVPVQGDLASLESQEKVLEQAYQDLLKEHEQLSAMKAVDLSPLQIFEKAKPPEAPAGLPKKVLFLVSGVLGLGLGVGVALFLEYLNDSIRKEEEVARYLALPTVGAIPTIKPFNVPKRALERGKSGRPGSKAASGKELKKIKSLLSHILIFAERNAPVITDYRRLGASIKYASEGKPIKTLLITSGLPGEGKTATAVNLAISLAQVGQKVLLVDADLRAAWLQRILRPGELPGLADLLAQNDESSADLTDFIHSTEVENLSLLPAGHSVPSPEALLSSERMQKLVEELSKAYDIIIFDSPPLLAASDALALSTYVDGALMVVRSGKTKQQMALRTKTLLMNVKSNVFGVVLNDIDYPKQYGSSYYVVYPSN